MMLCFGSWEKNNAYNMAMFIVVGKQCCGEPGPLPLLREGLSYTTQSQATIQKLKWNTATEPNVTKQTGGKEHYDSHLLSEAQNVKFTAQV